MKDSEIEWIGQIPENWKMLRMKNCITIRNGGAWGDEASNTVGDCICLRIADFDYNHFKFKDTGDLTLRHYDMKIIQKLKLQHNDILIEKSGGGDKTPVGRSVIFDKCYVAIFANFMDRIRCRNFVFPMYFQYILVTFYKNNYTKNYINQTTGIQNLDLTSMFSKEQIYLPPLLEQQKIADYLDKKCEKIDTAIDNQKQIIEKLKEYKQSLITETVTKGLNPSVQMKDSGIEWIGFIPEHWEMAKFKVILLKKVDNRGRTPELSDNENDIPLIEVNAIGGKYPDTNLIKKYISQESHDKYIRDDLKTGDIIVTTVGATIGKCSVVPQSFNYCIAQNLVAYRVNEKNYPLFWSYYFKSQTFQTMFFQYDKGNTINNVKISNMEQGYIVIPTFKEQKEIAEYLDKKCNQIDEAIKQKEETISKLEEYKKSLIFECVTGKKEVA